MVYQENIEFWRSLWYLVGQKAVWVNPYDGRRRANSKLLQLTEANRIGMKIPKTLVSNDPRQIRKFIAEHAETGAIYKPFFITEWEDSESMLLLHTSKVLASDLPTDEVLKLTPGIFQPLIAKAYEVRVIFFGDFSVAVRLNSQQSNAGKIDWRSASPKELDIKRMEIPQEVKEKCKVLMNRLGIVFGSFDFIVEPDGTYVFLEVNENGQFLWIEDYNPEIPMLSYFCSFLTSNESAFKQLFHTSFPRYSDIAASSEYVNGLEKDKTLHRRKPPDFSLVQALTEGR